MRQRDLEIRLERVPPASAPKPHLEQYRTPASIAADVLYRALARGDVAERRVCDLGCGTGMFAIGAKMLGAAEAAGFDVDEETLVVARAAAASAEVAVEFQRVDVADVEGEFDTVIMNPPFGAQFAARHLDTAFVETAMELAPIAYSLHLAETEMHLDRLANRLQVHRERLARYDFVLPAQFRFHTRERMIIPVSLHRFERPSSR